MANTGLPKSTDQTQSLQSADQSKLLDEIDKLRSQGIFHYVSLPQLIVCGDQSSGKSSVLEAISGITFPSKDNLCTRFATEVILRRASTVSISVHIIPSKYRTSEEEGRLKDFGATLDNLNEFASLVDQAKTAMGISDTSGAFSNDVLRVEVSGPDRPHLTIVDLPGLFHSGNKMQSAADVTLVKNMVLSYMENRRSIILAVVSAKNDYANQAVLKFAKEVDASGHRTLGIITKPDTLSIGSESEAGFVSLAKNEDIVFRLGWHIVRNRTYEERNEPTEVRNATETAFFLTGIWANLPRDMVGISSLRLRLSKVLLDHIKAELPALVEDIEQNLEDCKAKLAKLGVKRATLHEQRLFLLQIGQDFQDLARAAIDGGYDNSFFGDSRSDLGYSKRLRAVIQNLNLEFAKEIRIHGHHRRIIEEGIEYADDDIGKGPVITRMEFEAEILDLLKSSRGRELPGMFNPLIVGEIFHQQAKPWEQIARDHVLQTWEAVECFLERALGNLTDEKTLDRLLVEVINPLMKERLQQVNEKLDDILLPHTHGHPITYNHYFTETVQAIRQLRQEKEIAKRLGSVFKGFDRYRNSSYTIAELQGGNTKVSDLMSALTSPREADMDKYACSEILLCMEAYYKVAMKMLVDNVAVQAVEACLLSQLPGIICPTSVMTMTDEIVSSIAAEPEENQALREQLDRKLAVLQSGLDICKRYAGGPKATTTVMSKLPVDKSWRGTASTSTSSPGKGGRNRRSSSISSSESIPQPTVQILTERPPPPSFFTAQGTTRNGYYEEDFMN